MHIKVLKIDMIFSILAFFVINLQLIHFYSSFNVSRKATKNVNESVMVLILRLHTYTKLC